MAYKCLTPKIFEINTVTLFTSIYEVYFVHILESVCVIVC